MAAGETCDFNVRYNFGQDMFAEVYVPGARRGFGVHGASGGDPHGDRRLRDVRRRLPRGGTSTTSGCSTSSFETGLAAGALLFPRHMACGFTHALSSCAFVVRRFDPPQVDFTVKRWRECWVRGVTIRWTVRYPASEAECQRYRIGRPVRYPDGRTNLELIFQMLFAHVHTFPCIEF